MNKRITTAPVKATPAYVHTNYQGNSGPWNAFDGVGVNQRRNNTKVMFLSQPENIPRVFVSGYANAIMWSIVDLIDVEASWYATAVRDENGDIHVNDVFIPQQTGEWGFTTITEDGEAELMEELLQEEGGADVIQNLACWGHSHHTMDVFASGQDENQARELIKRREDFYLRLIMNKRGDLNATIYLIDENLEIKEAVCVTEDIDPMTFPDIYRWVVSELIEKHTVVLPAVVANSKIAYDDETDGVLLEEEEDGAFAFNAGVPYDLFPDMDHHFPSITFDDEEDLPSDRLQDSQYIEDRIVQLVDVMLNPPPPPTPPKVVRPVKTKKSKRKKHA